MKSVQDSEPLFRPICLYDLVVDETHLGKMCTVSCPIKSAMPQTSENNIALFRPFTNIIKTRSYLKDGLQS